MTSLLSWATRWLDALHRPRAASSRAGGRRPDPAVDAGRAAGNQAVQRLLAAPASDRAHAERQEHEADRAADRVVSGDTPGRGAGASLHDVRIHASGPAADAARDLHVQAFTIANHIVCAPGRFDPATQDGRHLLSHELAHVEQQRTSGPRVQAQPEKGVPPYLWNMEARLRPQALKEVRMWARETGPISTLKDRFPELPVVGKIDIPAINWDQPPSLEERPHGEFEMHSRLPGGFELMGYDYKKGEVLIADGPIGYVIDDEMFAALFGDNGIISEMYEEFEGPLKVLHDKPWLPLAADLLQLGIGIGMALLSSGLLGEGAALFGEGGGEGLAGGFGPAMSGGEAAGAAGVDVGGVGQVFDQLGGGEMGYTVGVCSESTVIETPTSLENVGRLAKNQGGAYTNTTTKTVWIDESVVAQGGITRSWGQPLSVRQILAHELGHVESGSFDCAIASRTGAELPGLTDAERQGLLDDAAHIEAQKGNEPEPEP